MNIKNEYDVIIVGAGASGMTAAIEIAQSNKDISLLLLEKKDEVGLKIKATGNGRCNISHNRTTTFGDSVKFFRKIGVEIKTDEYGRAYPVSERAEDVVKALKRMLDVLNVETYTNFNVEDISKTEDGFIVVGKGKKIQCKKLILSTGGKAGSSYGSTGDGFKFAKKMGHNITNLRPILTPIICKNKYLEDLQGIRAKGSAALHIGNHQEILEFGEIQFTKDGLSGICIFNISTGIELNDEFSFESYHIRLNLLAAYDFREIFVILKNRQNILGLKSEDILMSIVNEKIGKQVLKHLSLTNKAAKDLTDEEIETLIYELMNIKFEITNLKGWQYAQATGGGITFSEFNYENMMSNKCEGLYFTGELIDYDGECGGYNLENAWNTGRKAGKAVCTELAK